MKKLFFILLSILFLTSTTLAISTKIEGAKLRSGPGKEYKIKMDMPKYYPLRVLGRIGKWYKVVDWQGVRGWIHKSTTSKQRTAIVRKIKVNFRSGPGRRYRRLGKLYKGYTLKVLKKYGYWYKIKVIDPPENKVGWIARWLVWAP